MTGKTLKPLPSPTAQTSAWNFAPFIAKWGLLIWFPGPPVLSAHQARGKTDDFLTKACSLGKVSRFSFTPLDDPVVWYEQGGWIEVQKKKCFRRMLFYAFSGLYQWSHGVREKERWERDNVAPQRSWNSLVGTATLGKIMYLYSFNMLVILYIDVFTDIRHQGWCSWLARWSDS
jgi:hypothetical protein